jgi:hypothetical protein
VVTDTTDTILVSIVPPGEIPVYNPWGGILGYIGGPPPNPWANGEPWGVPMPPSGSAPPTNYGGAWPESWTYSGPSHPSLLAKEGVVSIGHFMSSDSFMSSDPANNGTLPNGDVPIYGLTGHGADILAAAGKQASHDLGCAGMGWAVQGASVAASGAVLSTGAKLGGATSGTSVASATARTLAVSVPSTPTPVGIPFTESFAWRSSSTLGGVLGRWFPYIGTAISAALFNHCVDQHP